MAETEKNLQSLDPIPEDVLFEIFLRLPVKSLARFVSVSKLCAKIIRNQGFIRSFSSRSSLQIKQPHLLLAFKDKIKGYQEHWYFFSKSIHEPNSLVEEEPPNFVSSTVCHFKNMRYHNPSCVNGLIGFLYGEEQVICNPRTGKSITLPAVKSNEMIIRSFLGYDPIHGQYKVLCLTIVRPYCQHQVLTLGAQNCSWSMIQCSTPHYPTKTISVCIDGVLYYSAYTSNFTLDETLFLVRFDLMTETLEIASLYPEGLVSSNKTSLINYHGKVAVVSKDLCGDFKLWVLEDSKKQQWSKEQHISIRTCVTGELLEDLEILGISDFGEIIFAPKYFKELVVYFLDPKSNQIRSVELEGDTKHKFRDFYKVYTFLNYVESVMLL